MVLQHIDDILRAELTDEQYAAATDDNGEVLCLACAGSGKSKTLAFRIARLVSVGADPKSIVAFTFTEKAAQSIKRRVATALAAVGLPETTVGAMYIGTIHAYCQYILGSINARYRQFQALDDNGLTLYLMSRYPSLEIAPVRAAHARANGAAFPYFRTISEVADAWKIVNDELIDIADVVAADPALGGALVRIRERLNADHFIDFSLMIRLVVEALQNGDPGALAAVADLEHLMVDEYQDVNTSQEQLIQLLHAHSTTLFVVGDDDQSIYGWRGADVQNILTFGARHQVGQPHSLNHNFRSSQAIVRTADAFAAAELGAERIAKNPTASDPEGPRDFRALWFDSQVNEAVWVAQRIESLLGTRYVERDGTVRGLTYSDFAILMRVVRGSAAPPRHTSFTAALTASGIPYTLDAGGGLFERIEVQILRDGLELLRTANPTRQAARTFFDQILLLAFPGADFNQFAAVLARWGAQIHAPAGGARQRIYPQTLVHELLEAFGIQRHPPGEDVMFDLGVFSRIIQDVESVYMSVDSEQRYAELLNFLQNVAETGYSAGTDEILQVPNTVTVSTVHKIKGLEFPVTFVVDVEQNRFPGTNRSYQGWLPQAVIAPALARGAYVSTPQQEARLFYTALTRAERYLYVTGSEHLGGARAWRQSRFALRLQDPEVSTDSGGVPSGLEQTPQRPRIEERVMPTSFSDLRYYLRCPYEYRLRKSYGFSPTITEMFGFGQTVHSSIGRLHQQFPDHAPTPDQARNAATDNFHLKHIPPSGDPQNRPGGYERARESAAQIAASYAEHFGDDFAHSRQVEQRFEVPAQSTIISGAIDLLLRLNDQDEVVDATVVDFKAIEGGDDPFNSERLDWTALSLQVQLYAHAASAVLGANAQTGHVHLLKDGQRLEVPVNDDALASAIANVEWAVGRILEGDFPMRPQVGEGRKCGSCDFRRLCPQVLQNFGPGEQPPPLHLPDGGLRMAPAFSEVD